MITRSKPENLPDYGGVSHIASAGEFVFIAGQTGIDKDLNLAGPDIETQLDQLYRNLELACTAAGVTIYDIIKTTTFITQLDNFPAVQRKRKAIYGKEEPANSTIVVTSLVLPELLVEIEGIAYAGPSPA